VELFVAATRIRQKRSPLSPEGGRRPCGDEIATGCHLSALAFANFVSLAEAERILYFTLMSAIDAGLIRTMEDALRVLRHASQPPGPMGAEWLERLVESDYED